MDEGCFGAIVVLALVALAICLVYWVVMFLWSLCAWMAINVLVLGDMTFSGLASQSTPFVVWAVWGFFIAALGHFGVVEARRLNRPAVGTIAIAIVIVAVILSLLLSLYDTDLSRRTTVPPSSQVSSSV